MNTEIGGIKMADYYKEIIRIPNGAWIARHNNFYDFWYKEKILLTNCINYTYISRKLIILKKDNVIHIFSTNIINKDNHDTVEKIAEFKCFKDIAYVKIICEQHVYLIDMNCQIKLSSKAPIN